MLIKNDRFQSRDEGFNYTLFYFLLGLITIITIYPFLSTGLSNADDYVFYSTRGKANIDMAKIYAKETGRFHFLITLPLYNLPFIFNNLLITRIIHLFFYILNYALGAVILYNVTRSKHFSIGLFLTGIITIQALHNNDSVSSFPFYFCFSFTLILVSFLLVHIYYSKKKLIFLLLSVFLFMFSLLFYEVYLTYFVFIVFYIYYQEHSSDKSFKSTVSNVFKRALPFIIVVVAYLSAYLLYRHYHPTKYDGSTLISHFTFKKILITIYQLASGAFPLKAYGNLQRIFVDKSEIITGHHQIIPYILYHARIEWIIKACLVFFVLYNLMMSFTDKFLNRNSIFILIVIFFLLVFLPQLPLGVSEKYITYCVSYGMWEYVTAYYSHFGIIGLITILVFASLSLFKRSYTNKKIYIFVLCIIFSITSILIDYSNYYIVKDLRQSHLRFKMFDIFLKSEAYNNLKPNSILYSPDVFVNNSIGIWGLSEPNYIWNHYFQLNGRKDIKLYTSYKSLISGKGSNSAIYYLYFNQARKTDDQIIALSEIINTSNIDSACSNVLSDEVYISYYSIYKNFSISYETIDTLINNSNFKKSPDSTIINSHRINIKNYVKTKATSDFVINSRNIKVNSIIISNILSKNTKKEVELW